MIPVYQPWLTDLEKKYVTDAIDTKWISSAGKYVEKAEELFADFIGVKHALVTTSGTTALHLCFRAMDTHVEYNGEHPLGFWPGVCIVPDTTFVASLFAPSYDRRQAVTVDVDPETWNLDLNQVEKICQEKRVEWVMAVHLYGNPCDMDRLYQLQQKYGFKLIEDACESLGATVQGRRTGGLSDVACFSFYGNKTFTCGEGGALTTNDKEVYLKAKQLRGQAQDFQKRYWHVDIGYNYRMTNLSAAVLCAQLERANEILAEKRRVANLYIKHLGSDFELQTVLDGHEHSYWLMTVKLPTNYKPVQRKLKTLGIDTRKIFYPISEMPPFDKWGPTPVAHELSQRGLSLPSYPELKDEQIVYICDSLKKAIRT